ncbi:MAG: bifunctional UDP-sugar hydrolase/5'-nucleotidase, partial [Planctomycetota bacterium]
MDDPEEKPVRKISKRWLLVPAGLAAVLVLVLLFTLRLPSRRIVILFTSGIRGHVVACGCYEGQPGGMGRIPQAAGEDFGSPDTLLVDAGDFVGNPPMAGFDDRENPREMAAAKLDYLRRKHAALVEIFKTLDVQAVAPGENDFLLGQSFLLDVHHKHLQGRIVNANIHFITPEGTTKPVFEPPYRIVTVGAGSVAGIPFGGVRVGVLGLIAPKTRLSLRKDDPYPNQLTVLDPEVVARRMIPAMREKGADLILLLYHAPRMEVRSFLLRVDGIDLAVAGHGGEKDSEEKVRETHLVNIVPGCTQVGRMVLQVRGGALRDVSFEALELKEQFPEDLELLAPYWAFQRGLAASPPSPPVLRTR